ncbi:nuclear transport factor 2 family protein [Hyphococcus lacteus]|uniref:Nuclear transport factor 2 family protein n=1 Tax=Hyphococcus lacteus TaxID=3143536 RepID=A0ABV3Z596_9PROT
MTKTENSTSTPNRDPALQALLDKQEITDVLNLYLRGADRADTDLIAAAYHPDAIEEHGGLYMGPADAYVAMMDEQLPHAKYMNHLCTNIIIELDGDKAHVESYILAYSRMKKDGEKFDSLTLARAVDRFERRDGAWKIAKRQLIWEWNNDMPCAETWGRGLITNDPSKLIRGKKKPDDLVYAAKG